MSGIVSAVTVGLGLIAFHYYYSHERLFNKARSAWVSFYEIDQQQTACFHDFYHVTDRASHTGHCWKCCLQEPQSLTGDEFNLYLDGYFAAYGQEW